MLGKKVFLSTFFALVLGLIGIQAEAQIMGGDSQDNGAKVSGEVKDAESEEGLANVEITVEETGETATTDDEGNFELENLEPGSYTIQVNSEGYEEHSETIEVTEDGSEELDITLRSSDGTNSGFDAGNDRGMQAPEDQPQPDMPQEQPQDQPGDETQPPVPPRK